MSDQYKSPGVLEDPEGRGTCSRCGQVFDRLNSHSCAGSFADTISPDALIGKVVAGKYEIISLVGQGGMSVVYKARQFPINKIVALKMLMAHLSSDESSVRRFLQEAKSAGQISHPNVVNVTDFGISENRQAFLVMDFLEGQTLAQNLACNGPLPCQEAIKVFLEICDGLHEAHKHHVIHRDIKPGNIVLQDLAAGQRVRLVDFGIAKMIDAESQHLTRTGEVFGSPLYMSPEQCEGRPLDLRSDIYSLGVVFYEVLCGYPPLAGQSALETMRLHICEMPESLQKASLAVPVPLALENIVFKMMAKDRDKRYASMLEVKHDLEQVLSGEANRLSGNLQHMGREISRKSKVIAVSSALLVVLVVSGVLAYPGLCSALAKHNYEEGKSEFQKGSIDLAAPHLVSAVDLSRKSGDVACENRSLGLLVEIYRKKGETGLLKEARKRRQEIIKAELSRLNIDNIDVDSFLAMETSSESKNLLSSGNSGGADASRLPPSPTASSPAQAPKGGSSGILSGAFEPEGIPVMTEMKKKELPQSSRPAAMPQTASARRHKQSANYLSMAPTPAPSLQGATNGTIGPPVGEAQGSDSLEEDSVSLHGSLLKNRLSRNEPVAGLVSDSRMKGSRAPAAGFAGAGSGGAGGGGAYLDASTHSAGAGYGFSSSSGIAGGALRPHGQNAFTTAGVISQVPQDSVQTFDRRAEEDTSNVEANSDKLERVKVLAEILLEHGAYARSRQCSTTAILISRKLNESGAELAQLYNQRAWAKINLGELQSARHDTQLALDNAKPAYASVEEAEAMILQSLCYFGSGNRQMAARSFEEAERLAAKSEKTELFRTAEDRYKKYSGQIQRSTPDSRSGF